MEIEMTSVGFIKSTRLDDSHTQVCDSEILFLQLQTNPIAETMLTNLYEGQLAEVTTYSDQIPGNMGTSICRITKIEGRRIYLEGEVFTNGTPVLGIFPLLRVDAPERIYPYADWMNTLIRCYWYWVT